ncbi:MAG: glutamate-5-semialdehyde dehydrogenase [Oscillospiraceae bacterium]|jgi:glutamate-5-semialdehyde dehydrogenase
MHDLTALGIRAKQAAAVLSQLSSAEKDAALLAIVDALQANASQILQANQKDLDAAQENGMTKAMQDRLRLSQERIAGMANAVRELVALPDPVGYVLEGSRRPNGLSITKVSVPLGVAGIIFESRPNVTVDCAALCLKSGNACILRGGKEAIHSNLALTQVMQKALAQTAVPADSVLLIQDTARETATALMKLNQYVDVLIPRGGAGLIQAVVQNATVPVIETGVGNCHAFIDQSADLEMAIRIVENGKTQRPSVCNALETLLVHQDIAAAFLPRIKAQLDQHGVELRGCPKTREILGDAITPVTEEDYETEFLDYILAVKVVADLEEAVAHIARYSSHHSEVIVTGSLDNSRKFTSMVDSAAVYVNASTRFTDGGEFGLGAEIGISTQKLHARGPMGLRELVSYKYIINGNGQTR